MNDNTLPPSAQPAPIAESVADRATASAIESIVTNKSPEQIERTFSRASVEHRRSAPPDDNAAPDGANDQAPPLGPMPDAPQIPSTEVTAAIARLNEKSDGHSDLVARWTADGSMGANLAYAKSAWKDMQSTQSGRDLIAKASAAGLGDDPHIIEHLSQFGRQQAGRLGDFTIARNNTSTTPAPFMPTFIPAPARTNAGPSGNARGSEETKSALDRLVAENAPGSEGYKNPQVQARIQQLSRVLAGSGSPIGRGGRTS